ncbi:hypothetical protein AKO1_004270, partial [Acrasis kona]
MEPIFNQPTSSTLYPSVLNNYTQPPTTTKPVVQSFIHPKFQQSLSDNRLSQELDSIKEITDLLESVIAHKDHDEETTKLVNELMTTANQNKAKLESKLSHFTGQEDPNVMKKAMEVTDHLNKVLYKCKEMYPTRSVIPNNNLTQKLAHVGHYVSSAISDLFTHDKSAPKPIKETPLLGETKNFVKPIAPTTFVDQPAPTIASTTPIKKRRKKNKNAKKSIPPPPPSTLKPTNQPPPFQPNKSNQIQQHHDDSFSSIDGYKEKEVFMEDECYPKLTEHEYEDLDDELDVLTSQIDNEVVDDEIEFNIPQQTLLTVPHQLSPDSFSTSSDSTSGPAYHLLATLSERSKPKTTTHFKSHSKINFKNQEGAKQVMYDLLDNMRQTEDDIVIDDQDKELDQLEGDITTEYEEEDEEEEQDEEEQRRQQEIIVEQELLRLEREVEKDRELSKVTSNNKVRYMDMAFFASEFKNLEQELLFTDRKKKTLELFFYKILKQRLVDRGIKQQTSSDDHDDPVIDESHIKLEGKTILVYQSGKKVIINKHNRSVKVFLPNGHILVRYRNGDLKRIVPRDRVEHFYKRNGLFHVLLQDKSHLYYNLNMRACEKKYNVDRTPAEMPQDARGLVAKIALYKEGQKVLTFTNGAKEIVTRNVRKVVNVPNKQNVI